MWVGQARGASKESARGDRVRVRLFLARAVTQRAQQAISFVFWTSGKAQRVGVAQVHAIAIAIAIAKQQTRQSFDGHKTTLRIASATQKVAIGRIAGSDVAATPKVTHQQRAAKRSEVGRCQGHAPGGVEVLFVVVNTRQVAVDIKLDQTAPVGHKTAGFFSDSIHRVFFSSKKLRDVNGAGV